MPRVYREGMEFNVLRRAPAALSVVLGALAVLWTLAAAGAFAQAHTPARAAAVAPLGGINVGGLESGSTPAEADRSIARAGHCR